MEVFPFYNIRGGQLQFRTLYIQFGDAYCLGDTLTNINNKISFKTNHNHHNNLPHKQIVHLSTSSFSSLSSFFSREKGLNL